MPLTNLNSPLNFRVNLAKFALRNRLLFQNREETKPCPHPYFREKTILFCVDFNWAALGFIVLMRFYPFVTYFFSLISCLHHHDNNKMRITASINEKDSISQLFCFDFSNSVSAALNASFKRRPLKNTTPASMQANRIFMIQSANIGGIPIFSKIAPAQLHGIS